MAADITAKSTLVAALMTLATPTIAQEGFTFVEANILNIFYHELGHAVVHTEEVPIFGQEEDAADVFAIFLTDALFEEPTARTLAMDAVLGYAAEAMDNQGAEVAWWDTHGPDEQRSYNTACLFYGADPDARADFAASIDLPEERAESCAEEYDQASASWGGVLDEMAEATGRPALGFVGADASLTAEILAEEVRQLNEQLRLAAPVTVSLESCGEANAFYDPEAYRITFCTEFEDHLRHLERVLAQ